jgi:hypothetical protein
MLSRYLPGATEKYQENPFIIIVVSAEIQIEHFRNRWPKLYSLSQITMSLKYCDMTPESRNSAARVDVHG